MRWKSFATPAVFAVMLVLSAQCSCFGELLAGFSEVDITPELKDDRPVWLAGYGQGRRATGVHDPIMARCVVLSDGKRTFAIVSADLVGLQYPTVQAIRGKLKDLDYVLVASTHNHEGPDVVGIWGKSFIQRGVDDDYLKSVVAKIVEAVQSAQRNMTRVTASYGTAEDETLLGDSRKPIVYDGVLRAIKLTRTDNGKNAGLLVQWNCHPEALGSKNTLLTADFPHATVASLKERFDCPVVYFSGAVGGLMAPPDNRIKDADGKLLEEGDFEYARVYGVEVAKLAERTVADSAPIELTPLTVSFRAIHIPVTNSYYRAAQAIGVLQRQATVWTGDIFKAGDLIDEDNADQTMAVETEVAYLRLGELHVAAIPGEIYPELVYGKFQEPADPGADFADAPLESSVVATLPGDKWLLLGLANDEIGYIIPKRQWDSQPPFAYGRTKSQYGEINSCGPEIAPIIMRVLAMCVKDGR